MIDNNLLVHELQLGEKLNQSIVQERRSDFDLMLAMLTQDVRDHSQFLLPESQQPLTQTTDSALRKAFELAPPARLAVTDLTDLSGFNQAQLIEQGKLAQIHLQDALQPTPLALRNDKKHIQHEVLTNTSVHCQQKHHEKSVEQNKSPRLDFNATGWLNAIKSARVQSEVSSHYSMA